MEVAGGAGTNSCRGCCGMNIRIHHREVRDIDTVPYYDLPSEAVLICGCSQEFTFLSEDGKFSLLDFCLFTVYHRQNYCFWTHSRRSEQTKMESLDQIWILYVKGI